MRQEDSASSVGAQRNGKMPQIYIPRQPMHSGCRSRVRCTQYTSIQYTHLRSAIPTHPQEYTSNKFPQTSKQDKPSKKPPKSKPNTSPNPTTQPTLSRKPSKSTGKNHRKTPPASSPPRFSITPLKATSAAPLHTSRTSPRSTRTRLEISERRWKHMRPLPGGLRATMPKHSPASSTSKSATSQP